MTDERRSLHIDWVQMAAGALAAVSSAVLLSTVGVAGTLIGAAVGSVVVTTGNAVYSHYLALSKERVAAAKVAAFVHARQTGSASGPASGPAPADEPPADEPEKVSWREAVSGLPWRRIAPLAAAVFVLALGAILAFELVTGRAVSTYTGGSRDHGHTRTSIPGLGGAGAGGTGREPTPQPTAGPSRSTAPTGAEPTPATPQPSAAASTQPPQPTSTPTPTPTTASTPTPSSTAKPSATPRAPAPAQATPSVQ